jgi:hypothetical protein
MIESLTLTLQDTAMSLQDSTAMDGTTEECLDEINDFVATLDRYPLTTLAVAMRVHLENLLRALLERDLCTRAETREFVRELERAVLEENEGGD